MFSDYFLKQFKKNDEPQITTKFLGFGSHVPYNTLKEMAKIIKESAENWNVIKLARQIIENVKAKDQLEEVKTIYNYVRDNTRYVKDPDKKEVLQTPLMFIDAEMNGELFQGDCDCLTILTLSLMKAIGYPVKLIATGYKQNDSLSHVFGAVKVRNKWIKVEPIKEKVDLGWSAPGVTKKIELEIS